MMLNGALLHFQSRQQSVVATSSAEAEFYGIGAGLLELLAASSMLKELHVEHTAEVMCDSSAGRALANRRGFGRTKHIDVKMAWIQETILKQQICLRATSSVDNLADLGTKSLTRERVRMLSEQLGLVRPGNEEPSVNILEATNDGDNHEPEYPLIVAMIRILLFALILRTVACCWMHGLCGRTWWLVRCLRRWTVGAAAQRRSTTQEVSCQTEEPWPPRPPMGPGSRLVFVTKFGECWHQDAQCPALRGATRGYRTVRACAHCSQAPRHTG